MPDSPRRRRAHAELDALDAALGGVLSGRGAPVVELVAPAPDTTPIVDAVSALEPVRDSGELTEEQRALLLGHDRMKRRKAEAEATAKALVRDIAASLEKIIELKALLGWGPKDWETLDDGQGFDVKPFEYRTIWPKYREDPETIAPYTAADVVEALRASGFGEIVEERPNSDAYVKLVRDHVKRWRQRLGKSGGLRDDQGRYVDAFGTPLTGAELDDPAADALGLPPELRRVMVPEERLDIRYTRREIESAAVAASDARDAAATVAAD